jgi:hypothetical protein
LKFFLRKHKKQLVLKARISKNKNKSLRAPFSPERKNKKEKRSLKIEKLLAEIDWEAKLL